MALITTFNMTPAGTAPTMGAAAASDTAEVGSHLFLLVENTNGATRTVTLTTPGSLYTGDAVPDKVYTVAITTGRLMIPLLPQYADPVTNTVAIAWEATAGVTRAVVRSL